MGTDIEEETPLAACPACGEITLAVLYTGWRAITRYGCVSEDCTYEHTIEHP